MRKRPARSEEETKEDLFHPGGLGFDNGEFFDRFEPFCGKKRWKTGWPGPKAPDRSFPG